MRETPGSPTRDVLLYRDGTFISNLNKKVGRPVTSWIQMISTEAARRLAIHPFDFRNEGHQLQLYTAGRHRLF